MVLATVKAIFGGDGANGYHDISTTTNGSILAPPSTVYSGRSDGTTNQLVPSMLAELSFIHEMPHPDLNELVSRNREQTGCVMKPTVLQGKGSDDESLSSRPSMFRRWNWNGLLCFSSDDPDLFFDAEESLPLYADGGMDPDGRIIAAKTSISSSELGESVIDSIDSIETELDHEGAVVATVCELRGGEQPYQPHHWHQPTYKSAAFSHQPDVPRGNHDNIRFDPNAGRNPFQRIPAPPAPKELPIRFLRAGKGDPIEGRRRYKATLQWRKDNNINNILLEAHPMFERVKRNYPHYFHLRGKNGEPVFFEIPAKTNLAALRAGGMDLQGLVRHYAMVTEFQWQFIETNDFARSITVFDLEGIRMMDFVGECVEYVKMCSRFTGQHYPERAGHVLVINVPRWFAMIWKVVKPMIDEVTLKKISIVRGKDAVFSALSEKIPVENIPPEYGGRSMPLGESPEEYALRDLIRHNNALARLQGNPNVANAIENTNLSATFSTWRPVRSY